MWIFEYMFECLCQNDEYVTKPYGERWRGVAENIYTTVKFDQVFDEFFAKVNYESPNFLFGCRTF